MRNGFILLWMVYFLNFVSVYSQHHHASVIHLWEYGAPGFESRKDEKELAKDWWIKNIHNPSLTVYLPPAEKATGTAVIICPGGGHRELVFNAEGVEAAEYFNKLGVVAFVLKYRLANEEGSSYQLETHVKQDAFRAMRLVRSRAREWNIDPNRLGMMGFSAGGEVVGFVAFGDDDSNEPTNDPIDRLNAKPDFAIFIYPGPLAVPFNIPENAPPAFLLAANDDDCCSGPIVDLLSKYRKARVPVEAHLYAQGKHAFNMGNRSVLHAIKNWPERLSDWLIDNNYLGASKPDGSTK